MTEALSICLSIFLSFSFFFLFHGFCALPRSFYLSSSRSLSLPLCLSFATVRTLKTAVCKRNMRQGIFSLATVFHRITSHREIFFQYLPCVCVIVAIFWLLTRFLSQFIRWYFFWFWYRFVYNTASAVWLTKRIFFLFLCHFIIFWHQ